VTIEHVREIVGADLTDLEAEALVAAYAAVAHLVARFPIDELRELEPPLRSFGGPRRA